MLTIALSGEKFNGAVRTIAIQDLQKRGGPEEAAALSSLLQPHQPISLRQDVAQALAGMQCNEHCIASILHYLERIFAGEQNDEDMRWIYLVRQTEESKGLSRPDYSNEQREIYEILYGILKRERRATFAVLVQTYGLASGFPSPFALQLVSRIGLNESCPFLIEARAARAPEASDKETLVGAINALACTKDN